LLQQQMEVDRKKQEMEEKDGVRREYLACQQKQRS
jgi:hypothetical protein